MIVSVCGPLYWYILQLLIVCGHSCLSVWLPAVDQSVICLPVCVMPVGDSYFSSRSNHLMPTGTCSMEPKPLVFPTHFPHCSSVWSWSALYQNLMMSAKNANESHGFFCAGVDNDSHEHRWCKTNLTTKLDDYKFAFLMHNELSSLTFVSKYISPNGKYQYISISDWP